jgi:hypothetical protein
MPDLSFEVIDAEVPQYATVPTLVFKLRVENADESERIHSISLRSQIQIAVTRRKYSPEAQARLVDLFGEPARWGETLRPLLWTHATAVVQQFQGHLVTDMPVACTYDFEVAATKYFDALDDGEIPLLFLFSGTVFYENAAGTLQAAQVPWSKEAAFRLPAATWKDMIARYFPNSAWIRLQKDVFDQLHHYKMSHGLPTWEAAIGQLLRDTAIPTNGVHAAATPAPALPAEGSEDGGSA